MLSMPCEAATRSFTAIAANSSHPTTCARTLRSGATGLSRQSLGNVCRSTYWTWRQSNCATWRLIRSTWTSFQCQLERAVSWSAAGGTACTHPSQTRCMWCSSSAQTRTHHIGGFTGCTRPSAWLKPQVRMWPWVIVCYNFHDIEFLDSVMVCEVHYGNP